MYSQCNKYECSFHYYLPSESQSMKANKWCSFLSTLLNQPSTSWLLRWPNTKVLFVSQTLKLMGKICTTFVSNNLCLIHNSYHHICWHTHTAPMCGCHMLCQMLNSLGLNYSLEDLSFNSQDGEILSYKKCSDCLWDTASLLSNGYER